MILRLCVAALLLLPPAAFAQGNPGPFGGLFGRTPERTGRDYTLFEIRTGGNFQYDDALLDEAEPAETRVPSGSLSSLNGSAMFERQSDRLRWRLRSSGAFEQFLQSPAVGGTTVDTSAVLNWQVGSRFSVDASATHLYSPFFQFHSTLFSAPMVGSLVVPSSSYAASLVETHAFDATGGFTSYYSKHSTLSASFSRRETRFVSQPENDVTINGARGLWTRRLNRDFMVRLGYGREHIRQRAGDREFVHEFIDAGVDFMRALSVSRRTTLAFNTQTSVIQKPQTGRHYRLNGSVSLAHRFRRTWQASVNANRTTEFLPGFIDPLFSDTLGLSVSGLLSKKSEMVVIVAGGRGEFGENGALGPFATAHGATQLSFAITRHFGVFGRHILYYFDLPAGVSTLVPADRMSRQSFSVGITAWIPVFQRERSASDSR